MNGLAAMSDELPVIGCCKGTRFRLIARDNWPGRTPGTEDVFKSDWFPTSQEAISSFDKGPNRWMRWSYALLIERCDGLRTWVHSLGAENGLD